MIFFPLLSAHVLTTPEHNQKLEIRCLDCLDSAVVYVSNSCDLNLDRGDLVERLIRHEKGTCRLITSFPSKIKDEPVSTDRVQTISRYFSDFRLSLPSNFKCLHVLRGKKKPLLEVSIFIVSLAEKLEIGNTREKLPLDSFPILKLVSL